MIARIGIEDVELYGGKRTGKRLVMDTEDARTLAKELLYFAEEAEDHGSSMGGWVLAIDENLKVESLRNDQVLSVMVTPTKKKIDE